MGRIIIALIILAALLYLFQWSKRQYELKGRSFAIKTLLVVAALILVALTAAGRAHWLGALLASLLAGLRIALPILVRSFPLLQRLFVAKASAEQFRQQNQAAQQTPNVTVDEALEILGLSGNPSREQIIDTHRKLIQKLHPDRGGNDYLAAKINQAKKVLLDNL